MRTELHPRGVADPRRARPRGTPARALLAGALLALPAAIAGAALALAPAARADEERPRFPAADAIDAAVAEAQGAQGLVGVGLAIAREGEIVYASGYGFADRERAVAVDPARTRFRWASISKPLTAVRAMQLWEAERLDLDADIRTLVPEFPEKPYPITARQLLCHQGGIVHYRNGKVVRTERGYDTEHPFASVILALDTFKESPLVCEPGTRMSYTTHGYILLGAVVERAGGEPFAAQIDAHLAEPLGMTTLEPDYHWVEVADRAKGYRILPLGVVMPSTHTDVSWKLAGGGFVSSVADLARFGAGMLEHALVRPETRARMWDAQRTRDGKSTGYGLGFNVGRRDGRLRVSHSGSQEGTATLLTMDVERRIAVALMCNTEGAKLGALGDRVLAIVAEAPPRAREPGARPRPPSAPATPRAPAGAR